MVLDIIKVQGLSKSYGNKNVLNDISFDLPQGEIIGLLGPNGCGKTTLMKILTGLIHDYSGSVLINGEKPGENTKAITAYLPEQTFVHEWMRNIDAVNYFNDFFKDFDKNKALELMQRFDLPLKQKSKTMSKGMQEKLLLSLVMSREASLYVLDEPMGGVDPATRASILDFIMKNYAEKSTLLISTHLINDLQSVFSHALFIGGGKVLVNSSVEELTMNGKTIEDVFKEVFSNVW
ncbi:MAG: ABC transporter ATP-binding protein [Ruminococcaceae bacterium]|nr:ABC transporter ATP-binding protein [Oscillospiraceae bacterium]